MFFPSKLLVHFIFPRRNFYSISSALPSRNEFIEHPNRKRNEEKAAQYLGKFKFAREIKLHVRPLEM